MVTARLHGPAVVVAISGEVDGSNAAEVGDYVHRLVPHGRAIVVDLTDLGFLGVQGIRALMALGGKCAKAEVTLAVVAGQAVARLLRFAGNTAPVVASVSDAMRRFAEGDD